MLADGCFDPLHIGHIRYLKMAAGLGELSVNIASDDDIRAKGRRPFQTQEERMEMVRSLVEVEYVSALPLSTAIHEMKPTYLVKGIEWKDRLPDLVMTACNYHDTHVIYVDTNTPRSTERLS